MAEQQLTDVMRYIRSVAGTYHQDWTDRALLAAFATRNDQAAFTTLVRRHGPMVLGVCRRVLHHVQDAEDAFQATFLLLARRSTAIRKPESLASWLYGAAYRMAQNAKRSASRRRKYEGTVRPDPAAHRTAELEWREVQAILDDAIQRLPKLYRAPFILFYVENQKHADIARLLAIKEGTVCSRLAHARRLLQQRLSGRGVALPAALGLLAVSAEAARAGVPGPLVASVVQAAARAAAGGAVAEVASAAVTDLLRGAHHAMTIGKCKTATLILLVAGVLGTGFGLAVHRAPAVQAQDTAREDPPPAPRAPKLAAAEPRAPDPKEGKGGEVVEVRGRVRAPDGKPVAGAEVAAVLWQLLRFSSWEREALIETRLTARTTSDAEGRFRLTAPQPPPTKWRWLGVLARAPGHGIGWATVPADKTRAETEVRLLPEATVAGRVVDLQGGPAVGVKIRARKMTWHQGDDWRNLPLPGDFVTATTDDRGRFAFRGVGRDLDVHLEIDDLHCAPTQLDVHTGDTAKAGHLVIGVAPPAVVEGRVVCADTGEPVANARLEVNTLTKAEAGYALPAGTVFGKTDSQGRYKVSTVPGNSGGVSVYSPEGQPYLGNSKTFDWPKGAVRLDVGEVRLSRGVLLHGKVTEAPSGKPVAQASVQNGGNWPGRVLTAADGSYSLAVPPGRARVLVTAASPDYITQPVGSALLELGKPGGDPLYYHAAATVDVTKEEMQKEVSFTLRRGVTLRGTLVGPEGKPVKDAVMLVGHFRPPWENALSPIEVHEGSWELHGCDPRRTYHVLFLATPDQPGFGRTFDGVGPYPRLLVPQLLGPKVHLGASLKVSAKNAGKKPLEVRLKPAGSARLHLVNASGKPAPQFQPSLELVVTPGPTLAAALETGTLAGETIYLAERLTPAGKQGGHDDPPGTLTVVGLIPGATYRVRQLQQPAVLKDFTAEADQTIDVEVPVP